MSGRVSLVRNRPALWIAIVVLMLGAPCLHAAEVVILRSGFTVTCTARETVSADTLRLFLAAEGATAGSNYMDVPLSSVVRVEAAPEQESHVAASGLVAPKPAFPSLNNILQSSGAAHNVNVALLASVVHAESAGNTRAVSRTGARGLMQLMPATAAQLHVKDSFAPEDNVDGGSAYLDSLLTRYHDNIALALAAYNAGPGAVDRFHGIPPYRETRLYVARVLREFNRLVKAQGAASTAAILPTSTGR